MNEATKVKIIGGLVVVGTALAGYLADLAAQGQFGVWSAVVGALAGAALTYLASKKAMTMLALFVAFVLSATACQAACRLQPRHAIPDRYPRDGEIIVSQIATTAGNWWEVREAMMPRFGGYSWCSWGDGEEGMQDPSANVLTHRAVATFDRRSRQYDVRDVEWPVFVIFDRETGARLP